MMSRETGVSKFDEESNAKGHRQASSEGTPWRTMRRDEEQVTRRDAHRAREEMINVFRDEITDMRSKNLLVQPDDENCTQCQTYVHHRPLGQSTFPKAHDTATDNRAHERCYAKRHPFGKCHNKIL